MIRSKVWEGCGQGDLGSRAMKYTSCGSRAGSQPSSSMEVEVVFAKEDLNWKLSQGRRMNELEGRSGERSTNQK